MVKFPPQHPQQTPTECPCGHDMGFLSHDDVIKWKHFPHHWSFVRGIHRSSLNSPHKGQWRGTLMFSLICAWTEAWVNDREASDLRHHRAHYDIVMLNSKSHLCRTFVITKLHVIYLHWTLGRAPFQYKNAVLPILEIPVVEIRQHYGHIISTAGIPNL